MKIEKKVSVLSNKAEQFTVTIPKEIVYRMNLKPKEVLNIVFDGEKIVLERSKHDHS